jgi:hypothetical protein
MAIEVEKMDITVKRLGEKHCMDALTMATLRLFVIGKAKGASKRTSATLIATMDACINSYCTQLGMNRLEVDKAGADLWKAGKVAQKLQVLPK